MVTNYFKLLRPKQWIKNLFVFAPMFFGLSLFELNLFVKAGLAFVAFCCMASSVYIFNDLKDVDVDRRHPTKRLRPLACGAISKEKALILSLALALFSFVFARAVSWSCVILLLAYGILNLAYSLKLKHVAIVDIFCIATGFVLRVFMGGFSTGISLSRWIIVMTFLLAIFLALGKRRDDVLLSLNGTDVRKCIEGYNLRLIDISIGIVTSITFVAYLMYTFSPEVADFFGSKNIYFTAIFVLLGIMRYLQLIFVFEKSSSPTEIVFRDHFLQIIIIGWVCVFAIILYKP